MSKPLKTEKHREDRVWFCNYLSEWDSDDFIHVAPCDEFFIYTIRKPNGQNDRILAKEIADIDEEERFQNRVSHPHCVGVFLLFTARKLFWIVKDHGESWNGDYFRDTVIPEVHEFLTDPDNVISVCDTVIIHDKAP